jgi:hypothetical protein
MTGFKGLVRRVLGAFALATCLLWPCAAHACAMITAVDGDKVFFANNEDYIEPGYYWVKPATQGRSGYLAFGFKNRFMQGGMNDKGLCFDAAVVSSVPWQADSSKRDTGTLIEKMMEECGSVGEVLALFRTYNCAYLASAQFMFADATGAAAVVTWGPDGKLSVVERSDRFLMNTNVRLEYCAYRCPRYVVAERILNEASAYSREVLARALDAIHQEGKNAFTTYSYIAEPKTMEVHIYTLANFGEVVTLNLNEELARGTHGGPLKALFKNSPKLRDMRKAEPRHYETEIKLDASQIARYFGKYRISDPPTDVVVRSSRMGRITMIIGTQGPLILAPESATKFRILPDQGQVSFQVNTDGAVEGFVLHRNGDHFVPRQGPLSE